MLTDQELQSLRNLGNQCEEAASEICSLRAALTQKRAEYEDLKRTMHNMARNHALQLEAARMPGVHSVQEQTAVIVRAALELLESIEGETPFTAEAARAFKRVFGARNMSRGMA